MYTPLHGVGAPVLLALFDRLGLPAPMVVPSQAAPDGDFPTVAFPNPEEPGALDAAYALATEQGADLVIANDPDADRLAVAELAATADQGSDHPAWRRLTGDELGVLLADCLLRRRAATGDAEPVLLAASVVSSQMLRAMAADAGAAYAATLTGFKWIARAAQGRAERLLFGYEEALGYAVCDEVRDKDGISAAALAVQLATALRAEGSSLAERLDDLYRHHGVYATGQLTVRFPAAEAAAGPAAATDRLRADPPAEIAAQPVVSVTDYLVAPARGPAAESGVAGEWIPASAGMTKRRAGMTRRRAGMTMGGPEGRNYEERASARGAPVARDRHAGLRSGRRRQGDRAPQRHRAQAEDLRRDDRRGPRRRSRRSPPPCAGPTRQDLRGDAHADSGAHTPLIPTWRGAQSGPLGVLSAGLSSRGGSAATGDGS